MVIPDEAGIGHAAAELRERGFRTNPVGVIAEDDQQLGRGVGAHTEALAEGRCCLGREAREVLVVYRHFRFCCNVWDHAARVRWVDLATRPIPNTLWISRV